MSAAPTTSVLDGWPPVLLDVLAPLLPLLTDPEVTDVLIDGVETVWVERAGMARERCALRLQRPAELDALVRYLARLDGADTDGQHTTVRLPDGSRVHCIGAPLAHRGTGPWITIRRFRRVHLDAAALVQAGAIPAAQLALLERALVDDQANIVCAGETGSGKTTFAEVLLRALPPHERLLIMQDVEEIVPPSPAHAWGSFRPGVGGYPALLRSLLRMHPDRLVLGECRGGEAWTLLEALTTGHSGGVTTVHAASPAGALRRLVSMAIQDPNAPDLRAVRARICDAVDLVVQLERVRVGDRVRRGVREIARVHPPDAQGTPVLETLWSRPPSARMSA